MKKWKYAVITRFARAAIAMVGCVLGLPGPVALRAAEPEPPPPATLRVLSYNIHHGEGTDGQIDLPRLARVIQDAKPDLVALQEVDNKAQRSGGVDQTAELARLTGMFGRFGRQIDFEGGEYGQAVLSRFPIEPAAIHLLPGEPPREQRIAFEVHARTPDGATLRFVTTHLHHANADFRDRQAARLNELFAESKQPVILAGDLNATPESDPLNRLRTAWTVAESNPPQPTFPAEHPEKIIDYVLIRQPSGLRVASVQVLDAPRESDHRPVLVVFQRDREPEGAALPPAR